MDSDLEHLNATFARPGAVSFVASKLGGIAAQLVTPEGVAEVALHGAHVLSFVPRGGAPVLWMSPEARIAKGEGIRGGIPVCWPWFAAHASDATKPDHGFVRKALWQVVRTTAGDGAAGIELTFPAMSAYASLWPHAAALSLVVTLSDRLSVTLETVNTGDTAFELTQALHSYFAVKAIDDVEVLGLDGVEYLDKLEAYARKTQQASITFAGEVDRIYEDTTGDVVIRDKCNARAIRVAKDGSRSTVVWNPWIEKSARLSHMPAECYRGMVCVETTNAGGDVVTLEPRATHRLTTILSTEPL